LTDPLTRLGNRFKLIEDIVDDKKQCLSIVDIQSFKELNDFYGHKIGDEVIRLFSDEMFHYFSAHEFEVYRLGGDEFAILAERLSMSEDEFVSMMNLFIGFIKTKTFLIEKYIIGVQLTCGISCDRDNLLSKADIAHKYSKKNNKDLVKYSHEINTDEKYKQNLEWTNEIKSAIDENRILAYYQPIVNASNNKIEKYETLMRLIKKDGTVVSPFFFLDIAKKTRLYKELTKIVVLQAFKKFSGTRYQFSVNLSAEDIILHDISTWIFGLAAEYNVSEQVVIEIVESEGIESFDTVDTFIHNAKENGMKIAIDDFGTGYSNFEYLIKLNSDFIKIDGSLIKEIDNDEKIYGVVETIVGFAKKNNIQTVAEFVASESIYEKIQELGIDYGQGFYLGKPIYGLVEDK